jgi:hypothetical protein
MVDVSMSGKTLIVVILTCVLIGALTTFCFFPGIEVGQIPFILTATRTTTTTQTYVSSYPVTITSVTTTTVTTTDFYSTQTPFPPPSGRILMTLDRSTIALGATVTILLRASDPTCNAHTHRIDLYMYYQTEFLETEFTEDPCLSLPKTITFTPASRGVYTLKLYVRHYEGAGHINAYLEDLQTLAVL